MLFLVFSFAFPTAQAWEYSEHVFISLTSFDQACEDLLALENEFTPNQAASLQKTCGDEQTRRYLGLCLGHMAALAGDFVGRPRELLDNEDGKFLASERLDCRLTSQALEPDFFADRNFDLSFDFPFDEDVRSDQRLLRLNFARWIDYSELVSANTDHFQPASREAWERYLRTSLAIEPGDQNLDEILANYAFALHFLEDSFSAGHNGLDRHSLRQDYDNAYHDDFNITGIFVSNDDATWHTYGDNQLLQPSVVIEFHEEADEVVRSVFADACEILDLNCQTQREYDEFIEKVVELLADSPKHSFFVASIDTQTSLFCAWMVSCDKAEFLVRQGDLQTAPSWNCDEPVIDDHRAQVRLCASTASHVIAQATASTELMLRHIIGDPPTNVDTAINDAASGFPDSYHSIVYSDYGTGSINADPTVISYSADATPNEEPMNIGFVHWGLAAESVQSDAEILDGAALSLHLRLPFDGPNGWRLENRYQIADDSGHFLDAFDVSLYTPAWRPGRNVMGLGAKWSIGIDNIWQGSGPRNRYAGIGLSYDFHIGKRILYLDVDHLWHSGVPGDEDTSVRIVFGIRFVTINTF